MNWVNIVMHFSDSTLPVGSYAHSFGLEGMCQMGVVSDEESFANFLTRDVLHGLKTVDLPIALRAYQATMDSDYEKLLHWDQLIHAMRPTSQLKTASSKTGKQMWRLYERTWREDDHIDLTFKHYHVPVVLGALFAESGAPDESALQVIIYQTYSALVQATLKLLPVGPTRMQEVLKECVAQASLELSKVSELTDDELGSFNPVWDIAASRHERAAARLFIS